MYHHSAVETGVLKQSSEVGSEGKGETKSILEAKNHGNKDPLPTENSDGDELESAIRPQNIMKKNILSV